MDAYWGKTDIKYRLPFQRFTDQIYFPETITLSGIVLSYTSGPLFLRGGVHRASVEPRSGGLFYRTIDPITIGVPPPLGGVLYVPVDPLDRIGISVLTLGAEWHSGEWRITGEYGQRIIRDTSFGPDSRSAYVTVARSIGKWTPYATYARLLSGPDPRSLYGAINNAPVPLAALARPPELLTSNYHQMLADSIVVFDQYSTMLGASYGFSATSKLKMEWMRTHVGLASALVDGAVHDRAFNVFSVSYSVAF